MNAPLNSRPERGPSPEERPRRLSRLAYSVNEVAEVTGLGRTTLYALMNAGTLPSFKIGGRRIIRASDLRGLFGECASGVPDREQAR